ncbi:MAG TPA: hypothetical protein VGH72_33660 [Pseudonocardia sp.]|jgi:hypothetical protein
MGFLKDFVVPTTHTVRHDAHKKQSNKCAMTGCNKRPRPGYRTCAKPQHINAFDDFG